jgi:hypothetical protein
MNMNEDWDEKVMSIEHTNQIDGMRVDEKMEAKVHEYSRKYFEKQLEERVFSSRNSLWRQDHHGKRNF